MGKYDLINASYEPLNELKNGKPCWMASSLVPVYLFHTGKTRWVISKRMDEGGRCYAYLQDSGQTACPTECRGPWFSSGDDGQWGEDRRIHCSKIACSQDPFIRLRMDVEGEMRAMKIHDEAYVKQMWKKLDKNGDDCLSVQEITDFADEMVKTQVWKNHLNGKSVIEKAYKKTLTDGDGDDKLEKDEFPELLLNLFWFAKMDELFQDFAGDDGQIDFREFQEGLRHLKVNLPGRVAEDEFKNMDRSRDGYVDFDEFCLWIKRKVTGESQMNVDGDDKKQKDAALNATRAGGGGGGTIVRKKQWKDFDALEDKIKAICKEPNNAGLKKLWSGLDFNGNGVVSLAEIDKWVVESYPLLNHKPALIRAQKATLEQGDGDDWVERKEFKKLIINLFYYNKLFWLFDQADSDHDRRMDFKEFQYMMSMCGVKLSEGKAKAEFQKIDTNGGGIVLFDEFCAYFTKKQCPEGCTDFIGEPG